MKKYLLIAASLLLCLPLAAAVQKVSLNSDGRVAAWQLRAQDEVTDVKAMLGAGYDASGWVAAVVPGAAFFIDEIFLFLCCIIYKSLEMLSTYNSDIA